MPVSDSWYTGVLYWRLRWEVAVAEVLHLAAVLVFQWPAARCMAEKELLQARTGLSLVGCSTGSPDSSIVQHVSLRTRDSMVP